MTTSLPTSTAVRTLIRAREILERDDWCQGAYTSAYGKHCLVGAVRAARPALEPEYGQACALLRRAIGLGGDGLIDASIVHWNDVIGREKTEVFGVLDRAISLGLGVP